MVTLALQHASPQGAGLHPALRPRDALVPCVVPGDVWVPKGLGHGESGQERVPGWEEGRSGLRWEGLGPSRRERSRRWGFVPGCVRAGFLPTVGLGQGFGKGSLLVPAAGMSQARVPCFLPVPALRIPVQASPSPQPSDCVNPSISECSLHRSLHGSVLTPSFRSVSGPSLLRRGRAVPPGHAGGSARAPSLKGAVCRIDALKQKVGFVLHSSPTNSIKAVTIYQSPF